MRGERLSADEPLPFDEAYRLMMDELEPLPEEECPLPEVCGRVLARPVHAAHDVPLFANSMVDGYAVHAADTTSASPEAPVELEVVGEVPAGNPGRVALAPGQAVRIMTGAPVPADADAIVMLEWTAWEGDRVQLFRPATPRRFIRNAGEDVAAGAPVALAGTRVSPALTGVLASIGVSRPWVHRQVSVAVLATGDELLELDEPLEPGRIRGSNQYVLAGLVRECRGRVRSLGIARDDREDLRRRIQRGGDCDVLLTSGGVSVGDHDQVQDVLVELGFRKVFWRVAASPGKPLLFGRLGNTLVFGLPGNPVSSTVCFENFVRPALLRLQGRTKIDRARVRALAETELSGPRDRRHFARVALTGAPDGWRVREVGPHGSGNLTSMVHANALAIVPEGTERIDRGDEVDVIVVGDALT